MSVTCWTQQTVCWLMVTKSPSHTYRQKNVAVTLIKVPIRLLWDLHQLHFLLHSGNKGFIKSPTKSVAFPKNISPHTVFTFGVLCKASVKQDYLNSPDDDARAVSDCSECVFHVAPSFR